MPNYSVVTTTVAQESETAEVDVLEGDFRSVDEAMGYARRVAEDLFELAAQLALDFEYTQVAIYDGGQSVPEELDVAAPGFVGMWMFVDDGVAWADADALREGAAEAPATS